MHEPPKNNVYILAVLEAVVSIALWNVDLSAPVHLTSDPPQVFKLLLDLLIISIFITRSTFIINDHGPQLER